MNRKELKEEIERKQKEILQLEEKLKNYNEYESIIILNPKTSIQDLEKFKKDIKNLLVDELEEWEELGTKILAYEIQGNKKGFYIRILFNMYCNDIEKLEKIYRINDNVLKFITVRNEE